MKLAFAFFADYALAHPDGKLYVVGGGVQRILAAGYPLTIDQLALVVRLDFNKSECGVEYRITINGRDPKGEPLIDATTALTPKPPSVQEVAFVHVVLNIQGVVFDNPGEYPFAISVDGEWLTSISIHAVERPAAKEKPAGDGGTSPGQTPLNSA